VTAPTVPPVVSALSAVRLAGAPAAVFFDLLTGDESTAQSLPPPLKER
jgi:hypothetical protein